MTTKNSRADVMVEQIIAAAMDCIRHDVSSDWQRAALRNKLRAILAASPVEQPAAAPVPEDCDVRNILLDVVPGEDGEGQEVYARNVADVERLLSEMGEKLDAVDAAKQPAPSPADERAALSDQDIYDKFSFLEGLVNESTYVQIADTAIEIARAASSNEKADERAALDEAVTVFEQAACHETYRMRDGVAAVLKFAAAHAASASETGAEGALRASLQRLCDACNERARLLTGEAYLATEAIPGMRDVLTDSERNAIERAISEVELCCQFSLANELRALLAAHDRA